MRLLIQYLYKEIANIKHQYANAKILLLRDMKLGLLHLARFLEPSETPP